MTGPETPNAPRSEADSTDVGERADRIKLLQYRVADLGPVDPDFDMKPSQIKSGTGGGSMKQIAALSHPSTR